MKDSIKNSYYLLFTYIWLREIYKRVDGFRSACLPPLLLGICAPQLQTSLHKQTHKLWCHHRHIYCAKVSSDDQRIHVWSSVGARVEAFEGKSSAFGLVRLAFWKVSDCVGLQAILKSSSLVLFEVVGSIMEGAQRRMAAIARHLTDSTSLHALAYEHAQHSRRPGDTVPVVIGGMVLDIQATPTEGQLLRGSTTPGEVTYVRGGVARNVAENMALLGTHPFLISVVGDDVAGEFMLRHWKSLGLSTEGICRCKGATTPMVSAVFDKQGELAGAVADTDAIEKHLTAEWIKKFEDIIKRAPVVMLDANLLPPAMEAACKLAKETNVPIFFEPVSVAKSVRASKFLNLITYISPNEAELVAMAESLYQDHKQERKLLEDEAPADKKLKEPAASLWQMRHCIRALLDTGLDHIILTMGSSGAVLCSLSSTNPQNFRIVQKNSPSHSIKGETGMSFLHFPALPASVSNLSGAGDCLVAGTMVALSSSADISSALAYGVSASKWAVESDSNVPQKLDHQLVSDGAKKVMSMAQQLVV